METTETKRIGHVAGSMAWLCLLYGALLYVTVGALGVSELTRRIGSDSANIIHMIEVARDIRTEESANLHRDEAQLRVREELLDHAIGSFRDFGVAQGLALQDLQPIIDRQDLAPRLSTILNKPVDMETEKQWATVVMGAMMQLQLDIRQLRKAIDDRHAVLRSSWSAHAQVQAEAKRFDIDPVMVDRAAGTATTLQQLGYAALFALPTEILTLLLALSMGALGSTLHITKTLLTPGEGQCLSYYFIRPFQGMVTSLVVFVLLKAGQLTISAGDADNLNIFFVSFAGIASGLLAEEAYRMIRKAGAGIIKTDDAEARWAFKLKAAMDSASTTPERLAAGIGSALAEVESWISEAQPVPPLQQRLIAAWLHVPERELFTSQPPEDESPPSTEAAPAPSMPS
ncbi:hypothetical protein [Paramagnetospirillum magneticum]|uniref:Uncharacterized protein n=1 Tax=Paramagnetospirillum magneticum (strain ATCC 700264 / AMB-1) TaxID=342108 RepID=Q2W3R8_PARM1|nr:hypothetical protein [Paramagnetospirillum magneticum]BAE51507.1 hypothetical protein amb2703 [Paramagnetospirillum magneticum AMB-1]